MRLESELCRKLAVTMTEQEAEAMAARLTRIWDTDDASFQGVTWEMKWSKVYLSATVCTDVYFSCIEDRLTQGFIYTLGGMREGECMGGLVCFSKLASVGFGKTKPNDPSADEFLAHFKTRWIAFFRRNCWLSGCPIEASAHEKADWLRGFTQEEIETWNLKM